MTRDDEPRPEPAEPSGAEPDGPPADGRPEQGWDAAGIDAAFADIVARLQAGDVDTAGGDGTTRDGTTRDPDRGRHREDRPDRGRRPRHARDEADPMDDTHGSGDANADGADAHSDAHRAPGAELGPGSPVSGDPPGDASATDADPLDEDLDDPAEAAARRRARIEREVDFAVDGPDGGRFVPPEPAPLPRPDAITLLAWIAVIGGPLFLVAGVIAGGLPTWVAGAVVAAVVVGFVLLVSRLPRRGETDPDDDGAVV